MVLIFLSWILMFFVFFTSGILLQNIFKIENKNLPIIVFLGMFLQCFLLTICCFFSNIGIEIFAINLISISILNIIYRNKIRYLLYFSIIKILKLPVFSKILVLFESNYVKSLINLIITQFDSRKL